MLDRVRSIRVVTFALAAGVVGLGIAMAIRASDSSSVGVDVRTVAMAAPGGKGPAEEGGKGPKGGPPKKEVVAIEQVPAAVRETLRKHAGDVALSKLEKETKGQEVAYKADWGQKGQMQELKVAEDGKVLEFKKDVLVTDLPEVVAAAAKKELGDLKGAECKRIQDMKKDQAQERYEIRIDVDGQKKHIAITPDGKVEVKGPKGPKPGPQQPKA